MLPSVRAHAHTDTAAADITEDLFSKQSRNNDEQLVFGPCFTSLSLTPCSITRVPR